MSETSGHWQAVENSQRCEFKYRRDVLVREYQMQKVTVNVIRKAPFRFALRIIVFSKSRYYILAKMVRSRLYVPVRFRVQHQRRRQTRRTLGYHVNGRDR